MIKKEGFPSNVSLKKGSEFRWIIRRAKKVEGEYLIVFRLRGEQPGQKFGIRVNGDLKGSVLRNRLKRAIRETLRKNKHGFEEKEKVVVVCKKTAGEVDISSIREELERFIFSAKRNAAGDRSK